ncbi:MAG: hypothetical protein SWQ30_01270 [Thermodesulfobacteriota bacterium]|nr:hypothetical protein [Thermodesulfobacteriota bacterium]
MEYLESLSWDIWLHASGIILWCATIIYLKKRGIRKQSAPAKDFSGALRGFKTEVYSQLIKQQAEEALERLSHTVTREQNALRQLIANTTKDGLDSPSDSQCQAPFLHHGRRSDARDGADPASIDEYDPYGEVARLLELGFGEKEISQRVSIPRSQISLITNLKKYGQISHGNNT